MLHLKLTNLIVPLVAVAVGLGACGSEGEGSQVDDKGSGSGSGESGGASGASGSGMIFGGGGGAGKDGGGSGGSSASSGGGPITRPVGDSGCSGEILAGETIPLDIYVMFDQSGSMATPVGSGTRMDAVRSAVKDFLSAKESAGLGVGLGYFGYMPIGQTSCDPADYATPAVKIAELPGNANALKASLDAVEPTGETPTGPAIHGACGYAQSWKKAHPTRAVVMLFVTDGIPEAPVSSTSAQPCAPTLAEAVAEATACAEGSPNIPIYVLGVGSSLSNLNQIAAAGKTKQAYLVSSANVADDVLAALNAIRGDAIIPCKFQVPEPPEGESLDFGLVNAVFTDAGGSDHDLYYVERSGDCDPQDGGWYYDNPSAPQTILLCPATCDAVSVPGGVFYLSLGCKTLVPIR